MAAMAAKVAKVARVVRVDRGDGVPVLLPHEVKESDHDVDHTPGGFRGVLVLDITMFICSQCRIYR